MPARKVPVPLRSWTRLTIPFEITVSMVGGYGCPCPDSGHGPKSLAAIALWVAGSGYEGVGEVVWGKRRQALASEPLSSHIELSLFDDGI